MKLKQRVGLLSSIFIFSLIFGALNLSAADLKTNDYTIRGVKILRISGEGTLYLSQGDSETLQIVGTQEELDALKVDQTDNRLSIEPQGKKHFWNHFFSFGSERNLEYHLQVKDLNELQLSGAVNGVAKSLKLKNLYANLSGAVNLTLDSITADDLKVDGSGAVNLTIANLNLTSARWQISGACNIKVPDASQVQKIYINASGASNVHAEHLAGDDVDVDVSGASHIRIRAIKYLTAQASGASSVEYGGDASVKRNVSGISHISKF